MFITMKSIVLLSMAACCWLGSPLLMADDQQPTAAATAAQAAPHPFFEQRLYPAWSRMTPQQAATDIREAMRLAKERQAAIRSVAPEQANWENVFAA